MEKERFRICTLSKILQDKGFDLVWLRAIYFIYHNNLENYSLEEIITLCELEKGKN
jgi:uncharacterized membrane protein YciS (DUF1049 family)